MLLPIKACLPRDGCTDNKVKLQPNNVLLGLPKWKPLCHPETRNIRKESWNEFNRIQVRRIHSAALQVCFVTRMSCHKLFHTATCVKPHVSIQQFNLGEEKLM